MLESMNIKCDVVPINKNNSSKNDEKNQSLNIKGEV